MNEPTPWLWPASFEPFATLGLATALLISIIYLATRCIRSARWQQILWQVAILGTLGLLLAELSGLGTGLASLIAPFVPGEHPRFPSDRATVAVTSEPPNRLIADGGLSVRPGVEPGDAIGERELRNSLSPLSVPLGISNASVAIGQPIVATTADTRSARRQAQSVSEAEHRETEMAVAPPAPDHPATLPSLAETPRHWPEPVRSAGPTVLWANRPIAPPTTAPATSPLRPAAQWCEHGGQRLDTTFPLAVWAAGSLGLTLLLISVRLVAWRWLRRRTAPASQGLVDRAAVIVARHGLRRNVRVVESGSIPSPLALGVVRPTVVLPPQFSTDFSLGEQDAILAHELSHLAAGDPLWQLVADLTAALMWWHPLVWCSRYWLRLASETAADDASLLIDDGPRHLAAGLVTLGQRLAGQPVVGWLSATGPRFRSGLGKRVERLLKLSPTSTLQPPRSVPLIRLSVTLMLVLTMVFCTTWARPQVALGKGETSMNIFKASWNQSLVALLVAALVGPASDRAQAEKTPPAAAAAQSELPLAVQKEGPTGTAPSDAQGLVEDDQSELSSDIDVDVDADEDSVFNLHQQRERILHQSRRLHHALEQKAHELVRQLDEVVARERPELAETLHRQIDKIREQLERIEEKVRSVELEELQAHIDTMRREVRRLMAAGEEDGAQRVEREIHRVERAMERMRRPGPPPRPRDRGPDGAEPERRLEHVRAAIENLRAAGLHDEAARLERRVEQTERDLRERFGEAPRRRGRVGRRSRPEADRFGDAPDDFKPPRPPRRPGRADEASDVATRRRLERRESLVEPPHGGGRSFRRAPVAPPAIERMIDEMREQIDVMRDQMQEMREEMRQLVRRVGEDEDDEGEEDENDGEEEKDDVLVPR